MDFSKEIEIMKNELLDLFPEMRLIIMKFFRKYKNNYDFIRSAYIIFEKKAAQKSI